MKTKILVIAAIVCALCGQTATAAKPRAKAKAKAWSADAVIETANDALMLYDADALQAAVDEWREHLRKGEDEPDELRSLQNRAVALSNMLGRVERIIVADSSNVDMPDLLAGYRLTADAGKLGGTQQLTSFTPASAREIFYTARDSSGHRRIMHAEILDDGTRQNDVVLDLGFDEDTDVAYPYMLSDGSTLYFAANPDDENSLGGYDIYMTRRDEQGEWLEPTNLGMPYNSPGNDFMMVIDESAGLGHWATDRNTADGTATIYTFVPNESRINYDADTEGIADLAFITDISKTWPDGFDAAERLSVLANNSDNANDNAEAFTLSLGNGKVYTSLDDFHNATARADMEQYLKDKELFASEQRALATMRTRYGAGDLTLSDAILALERKVATDRQRLRNNLNAIITAETR